MVSTQAEELRFRCTDGSGESREVAFHVEAEGDAQWIVPEAELVAGETCVIGSDGPRCDGSYGDPMRMELRTGRAELGIGASTPLPSAFGTLRAEAATTHPIWPTDDRCEATDVCGIEVEADLHVDTAPWVHALVFETLVDGRPWRPDAEVEHGTQVVFGSGTHSVTMRASLPGTDIVLESDPVMIDVRCGAGDAAGGCGVLGKPAARNRLGLFLLAVLGVTRLVSRAARRGRGEA
jgi:hypothetical protein